jgi:hypothetical protein
LIDREVSDYACFSQGARSIIARSKKSARQAYTIFKIDPFDSRLRTHKIHQLSALYKKTIYAVRIENDLRSIFYIEGEDIVSVDIGSHAIYRS